MLKVQASRIDVRLDTLLMHLRVPGGVLDECGDLRGRSRYFGWGVGDVGSVVRLGSVGLGLGLGFGLGFGRGFGLGFGRGRGRGSLRGLREELR